MDQDQKFNRAAKIIVILALALAAYLTKELITAFLLSFLIAYVFYPLYKKILWRTGRKSTSSFITMLLIMGILVFPIFSLIAALLQEVSNLVGLGGVVYLQSQAGVLSEAFRDFVETYLPAQFAGRLEGIGDLARTIALRIAPIIQSGVLDFASNVPLYITEVLIAAFFTYYFLIDGRGLIDRAVGLMPRREVTIHFLRELDAIYASLFRLFFATAVFIGAVGAVGFYILGVSYPILLGTLTGITALVPMVGPIAIFGPIALYFLALQDYIRAFATVAFGIVFLTVLPGNFLLPRLASKGASIHPLITLLAFTAPLLVVGTVGMILGPAVYGFVLASFRTWIHFKEAVAKEACTAGNPPAGNPPSS